MDDYATIYKESLEGQQQIYLDGAVWSAKKALINHGVMGVLAIVGVVGLAYGVSITPVMTSLDTGFALAGFAVGAWRSYEDTKSAMYRLGNLRALKTFKPLVGSSQLAATADKKTQGSLEENVIPMWAAKIATGVALALCVASLALPPLLPLAVGGLALAAGAHIFQSIKAGEWGEYNAMSEAAPYHAKFAREAAKALCAAQQAEQTLQKDMDAAFKDFMAEFEKAKAPPAAAPAQKPDAPKPPANKQDMG